ncbi:MAG: class I SAM-dependent methyltransferase [Deltaproteobacteria bacterium]|nr:class I SAM-dependent methyltransferase [Deltaproteobacteria bacterium]
MEQKQHNIFDDLFEKDLYVDLKNHFYNYRIRRKALRRVFTKENDGYNLEVGCGISPILPSSNQIIYSDISLRALQILKSAQYGGWMVVADATNLPFRSGVIEHIMCSEVIEHLPDDNRALREFARIMKESGSLFITFPHRKAYFSVDDRFVHHCRRYELFEMEQRLSEKGLKVVATRKILGPLEKLTMVVMVFCFNTIKDSRLLRRKRTWKKGTQKTFFNFFKMANTIYSVLVRLDALVMPRALSSVLLVKAEKAGNRE